ncbi:MAG TPA: MBL fold metallo-hydrolase [Clostridiaceae bacterium]|nr:MBL fold metallo-hydrolase [Clostridiaceae bacterium]
MREVYHNIFIEELLLPNNPLKYLNVFIIKGESRSMIIDCGFNMEETKEIILNIFEKHGLDFDNTILYLTHLHSDHVGLATFLREKGVEVYISQVDGDILNNPDATWDATYKNAMLQGLSEDNFKIEEHPGYKYAITGKLDYTEAVIGDSLKIGDYDFEIIDLSGHTPGMTGLYEKEHRLLFCGDHILQRITPNITFWGFEYGDSLGTYFKNLDKVYDMEIVHLFSSHRELVKDHRERIDELKLHHEKRLDEVRNALTLKRYSSIRDVTKQLHWDIRSNNFDEFPQSQKSFATGEAHAHLEHLRYRGEVDYIQKFEKLYYFLMI